MDQSLSLVMPVKDGRLDPTEQQKASIGYFLRGKGDKPVMVRLSKPKVIRSVRSNNYYWTAVVTPIADHTGHSKEEIHEVVKGAFLPRKFIKVGTKEIEIKKSTTDLTMQEFSEYILAVKAWAAQELNMIFEGDQECLPLPLNRKHSKT